MGSFCEMVYGEPLQVLLLYKYGQLLVLLDIFYYLFKISAAVLLMLKLSEILVVH